MKSWKRVRRQDGKLNNKGVSLVELIIAMTILSIVVVVIYQGFILSAQTNSKAKLQHKATSLAQNVLEGLKAENINTILHQFSMPAATVGEGAGSTVSVNFDILPMSIMNVVDEANPTVEELNARVGTFGTYVDTSEGADQSKYITSADGKYYLYLKDVEMENTLFDVLITIDGSPYKTGSDKGQAYNDQTTIMIPSMDTTYDALVANSNVYDNEGFNAVSNSINIGYDPTLAYRRITVTIDDMPILNPDYPIATKVTAKYEYFYSTNTTPYYVAEEVVFDSTENPEYGLRNVFLFFQPSYGHKADQIVVDNSDNRETELFLIKQQITDNTVQLAVDEGLYNIELEVRETPADITNEAKAALKLRTNLGVNLGNGADVSMRETYKYQAAATSFVDKTVVKNKLDYNDLTNGQSVETFFDVTIEVHRAGTGGTPADITAFRSQWGEQVAVITGSIRN